MTSRDLSTGPIPVLGVRDSASSWNLVVLALSAGVLTFTGVLAIMPGVLWDAFALYLVYAAAFSVAVTTLVLGVLGLVVRRAHGWAAGVGVGMSMIALLVIAPALAPVG